MPDLLITPQANTSAVSDKRRLRDTGGGAYAPEVVALSPGAGALAAGRAYAAGVPVQTAPGLGVIMLRALLKNPSNSTRVAQIGKLTLFSSALIQGNLIENPTTNLPTTAVLASSFVMGSSDPAQLQVLYEVVSTTAMGGGVARSSVISSPANTRSTVELPPLIIPPGQALGLQFTLANSATATLSVVWSET